MSECVVRMDIDEMPTACGPCKLSCTVICKEWTKVDRKEIWRTKSPNCPILAILPEGHGRLVDEKSVRWAIDDIVLEIANRTGRVGMTKDETMEYINNLSTIVPAEAERSET